MTEIIDAKLGMKRATELIKNGELVVFPTETVYGLGANAFDADAVSKIFIAKGRPQDNPLIVHISHLDQVKDIAVDIPKTFYILAEKFMPGAITIVLNKSSKIPSIVTAGGNTVAIRMPDNEYAKMLIDGSMPLAAPSANKSKHISPTKAEHVFEDLNGAVEIILDGGSCKVGIESTVLDLTTDTPTILRPGAITANMLLDILGEVCENGNIIKVAKSPGMKYTHYAPSVETVVASSIQCAITQYDKLLSEGHNPVIVVRDIYRDIILDRNIISLGITADDYMYNIYSALHDAEKLYDYILIEQLNGGGIESSVMNRVVKSAGGKVI